MRKDIAFAFPKFRNNSAATYYFQLELILFCCPYLNIIVILNKVFTKTKVAFQITYGWVHIYFLFTQLEKNSVFATNPESRLILKVPITNYVRDTFNSLTASETLP